MTRRQRSVEARGWMARAFFLLFALLTAACRERSDVQIARRILEDHRRRARVKPLPGAQIIRLKLAAAKGGEAAAGTGQIEWDGADYRETVSSAGWTRARGIQAGKAYLTDEDGVTRVASEPVLTELFTRSYFWRRAYLFDDLEKARIALGPADATTVSVQLTPGGGNSLGLTFSSRGDLISARSPGFDLAFRSPSRLTDASRPNAAVEAEIRSISLPVDQMADIQAGGWSSRWANTPAETGLLKIRRAVAVDGRIGGLPARIAIDAKADGPLRIRTDLARRLALPLRRDVFGRQVARGGPLEIGTLSYPAILLEASDEISEGADAEGGALFFRETIVELDPARGSVRFHDPARWAAPAGFFRGLLDDDGDRPVAILRRGSATLRLRAATAGPAVVLAPEAARRLGISTPGSVATDLRWGAASLPGSPVSIEPSRFDPAWGDDGALGYDLLLRFHTFMDMPRRWAYLEPASPHD